MAPDEIAERALIEASRWQRLALLATIPAALVAQPAPAAEADAHLPSAIMIEWAVANCDPASVPVMMLAMAQTVIAAAPKEQVDGFRSYMREGVQANYPDRETACSEITGLIKGGQ